MPNDIGLFERTFIQMTSIEDPININNDGFRLSPFKPVICRMTDYPTNDEGEGSDPYKMALFEQKQMGDPWRLIDGYQRRITHRPLIGGIQLRGPTIHNTAFNEVTPAIITLSLEVQAQVGIEVLVGFWELNGTRTFAAYTITGVLIADLTGLALAISGGTNAEAVAIGASRIEVLAEDGPNEIFSVGFRDTTVTANSNIVYP